MTNRVRREALRGAETVIIDFLSEVSTSEEWAELLKAPLQYAVAKGNRGLAQTLVAAGAEVGQALHEAVLGGYEEIATDLLEGGASTGEKDTIGNTPLHIAAREGKSEMARLLMLNGADKNALEELDRTPLCLAVSGGHVGAAVALMAAGADVGLRFNPGESVVHAAARKGYVEILRAAIEHGADVNAANNPNKRRALHWAAMYNDVETMGVLMEVGADIEAREQAGSTPLHSAAGYDSLEALMMLLKHGADVHARNRDGATPFHCAARYNRLEALVVLLKHGADVNAVDYISQTPLHWAAREAGTSTAAEVVDLLLRRGADETMLGLGSTTAVDVIGADVSEETSLIEDVERVRKLLVNAPADRVWRRRGYLVLCHAHPDRMELTQESSSTANGGRSEDWSGVVARTMGLQEEDILRAIVEYL